MVVDASVAVKWFVRDERAAWADTLLDLVGEHGACVPALFIWEIQNALLAAERSGRITSDEVDVALEMLRDLPIHVERTGERVLIGGELRLARQLDLLPYDAAYLLLALTHRVPLATADDAQARAARDIGLDVVPS